MKRMGSLLKIILAVGVFIGVAFLLRLPGNDETADFAKESATGFAFKSTMTADEYTFQISDVQLQGELEELQEEEIEAITQYVTLELLGYGGQDCLQEISMRSEALFTEDSTDKDEYVSRMERFNQRNMEGQVYTKGKAIGRIDNIFRNGDNLTVHLTIDHELTYVYDGEDTLNHCELLTGYMLELVMENEKCKIYTCQEDSGNIN